MVKQSKIFNNFNISQKFKNSIILIGNFDGLHSGHQKLFQLAKKYKNKLFLIKSWKRKEVLKDLKFYTMLPALLAPSFIITGIVINQSFITDSKDWGQYVIAKSFMFYSVFTVITLFLSGSLVDKFTSRKLLIFMNIPLLISTIVLMYFDISFSAFLFLGLIGISNGLANVLGSSTWAEIYGVKHIGSIKALTTALMVFSTAFGTALFGLMIDFDFSIEQISMILGSYILISLISLFLIKNKLNPTIL